MTAAIRCKGEVWTVDAVEAFVKDWGGGMALNDMMDKFALTTPASVQYRAYELRLGGRSDAASRVNAKKPRAQPRPYYKKPACDDERAGECKVRRCLRCEADFLSEWNGERICEKCRPSFSRGVAVGGVDW